MKKIQQFLFAAISVLFALSIAAESFAETTVGGTIDIRGRLRQNTADLNGDAGTGTEAYWEEKVNLFVDAKIAEGLKGYVELQSYQDCNWAGDGFIKWGTSGGCNAYAPNQVFYSNQSLGIMGIRYAFIDFMIPKTPVGIKIGHFPVVLGHSIWADTSYWGSDGLMFYSQPIKELMVGLGTVKGFEVSEDSDDVNLYVLMANYTFIPKNSAGLNFSYIHRNANNTGASNAYWNTISPDSATFSDLNGVKLWNMMITVDGSFDFGLNYKFELDKQFGKLDAKDPGSTTAGEVDLKGTGLAFILGASYSVAEIAEVKFNAAYGSGDKCATWSGTATGDACSSTGDKFEGYFSFNNYGYTMIYEDIVGQKTAIGTLGSGDFGLYNTMYINIGAGVTPLKDMSISLDLYYLRSLKELYYGQKKNIGWEGDLAFSYNIYKNLKWTFITGFFLPGNHYKAVNSTDTIKDDAAWAFEQVLSLSF